MEALIAAGASIVVGVISLIGVVITNNSSNNKIQHQLETQQSVTDCKIDELTREVREHNNFAKRMPVVEEQIRVVNHRINDLEQEAKELRHDVSARQTRRRKKNKRGFSEKLYLLNLILVWVYVFSIFWLTKNSGNLGIMDLSSYASGMAYAFAELGIHTGFIVWKAKVENCRKYKDVNLTEDLENDI